jgi:hypothetical protein
MAGRRTTVFVVLALPLFAPIFAAAAHTVELARNASLRHAPELNGVVGGTSDDDSDVVWPASSPVPLRSGGGRMLQTAVVLADNTDGGVATYPSSFYSVASGSYIGIIVAAPPAGVVYSSNTVTVAMYRSNTGASRTFSWTLQCLQGSTVASLPGTSIGSVSATVSMAGLPEQWFTMSLGALTFSGTAGCPYYALALSTSTASASNWVYSYPAGDPGNSLSGGNLGIGLVYTCSGFACGGSGPFPSSSNYPSFFLQGVPSGTATAVRRRAGSCRA